MGESNLIYMYHGLVIIVILSTAFVTLGGIIKRGIFSNIEDKYIKILVGALLIEISAAFIGVYKTLPQLKFYKSEEYNFDISYADILSSFYKNIDENDKNKLGYFLNARGEVELNKFNICRTYINKFETLKDAGINGSNIIKNWENRLSSKEKSCIEFFKDETDNNMKEFEKTLLLLEKYARYYKSSNKTGKGIMYLSTKNNIYNGIATFRFPGDELYTVLEVSGQKNIAEDNDNEELNLTLEQAPSALSIDDIFIPRPGGKFNISLQNTETSKDIYRGKMPGGFGEIKVSLKN